MNFLVFSRIGSPSLGCRAVEHPVRPHTELTNANHVTRFKDFISGVALPFSATSATGSLVGVCCVSRFVCGFQNGRPPAPPGGPYAARTLGASHVRPVLARQPTERRNGNGVSPVVRAQPSGPTDRQSERLVAGVSAEVGQRLRPGRHRRADGHRTARSAKPQLPSAAVGTRKGRCPLTVRSAA